MNKNATTKLVKFVTTKNLNQELPSDCPSYKIMPITNVSLGFFFWGMGIVPREAIHFFNVLELIANEYARAHCANLLQKFPDQSAVSDNPYAEELNEQKNKWLLEQEKFLKSIESIKSSSASTLFSKNESSQKRVMAEAFVGGLLGCASLTLFFCLQPIPALIVAFFAICLAIDAIRYSQQENQQTLATC